MKTLVAALALFTCTLCVIAQTPATRLAAAWQKFESDPQLKYASFSLTVINARSGETVFSRNGNVGLAPASTLKTLTAATAFHRLGPEYRFQTQLAYTGTLSADGTLNGNLLIKGSGDPTLGSPRYAEASEERVLGEFVQAVKAAGIKKISGRIIGDDSLYGTQTLPGGWTWNDIGNYYGAGAPALTWRENQFDLIFEPAGTVGDAVRSLRTEPTMPFLEFVNEVTTGPAGSGDGVVAYAAPYQAMIYLRGTHGIDLKKKIGASVPDPSYEAAYRLKEALAKESIRSYEASTTRLEQRAHRAMPTDEHVLAVHRSPELAQVVYWLNQKSINLYGELLLRKLGDQQSQEPTFRKAAKTVVDFWQAKLAIDPSSLNIMDGSGLSPENRVTTAVMAKMLASLPKEPWFTAYNESLPVNNGIRMKSGSIQDVLAYAGYQPSASGLFAFSVIVNNYNGSTSGIRQKLFALLDAMK